MVGLAVPASRAGLVWHGGNHHAPPRRFYEMAVFTAYKMSPTVILIIGLFLGIAIGCALGWLIGSRRNANALPPDGRLENELRQQLTSREVELTKEREQLIKLNTACA